MCVCVCVNPVEWRRTGLWRPLHQFVGKRSDAFGRDGGEGEGVLSVGFQTLDCVRISRPEGQLLLRERERRKGGQRTRREGSEKKTLKQSRREKKRDEDCRRTPGLIFLTSAFIRPLIPAVWFENLLSRQIYMEKKKKGVRGLTKLPNLTGL